MDGDQGQPPAHGDSPLIWLHHTVEAADECDKNTSRSRPKSMAKKFVARRVLVVDVGGNAVKILASGHDVHRSFPSGPKMTPKDMVKGVKKLTADWAYDVVSIGYPGPVLHGKPVAEPYNLGR